jgi:hypothetical protein
VHRVVEEGRHVSLLRAKGGVGTGQAAGHEPPRAGVQQHDRAGAGEQLAGRHQSDSRPNTTWLQAMIKVASV